MVPYGILWYRSKLVLAANKALISVSVPFFSVVSREIKRICYRNQVTNGTAIFLSPVEVKYEFGSRCFSVRFPQFLTIIAIIGSKIESMPLLSLNIYGRLLDPSPPRRIFLIIDVPCGCAVWCPKLLSCYSIGCRKIQRTFYIFQMARLSTCTTKLNISD